MISFSPCAIAIALASFASTSDAFCPAIPPSSASAARLTRFSPPVSQNQERLIRPTNKRSSNASNLRAEITPEDLQPGDILAWETGDTDLERLVAFLSGDDYSHAAVVGGNPSKVYEQVGGDPTRLHDFTGDVTRKDRLTTITRLEGIDVDSVLAVAQVDVDNAVPYSWDGLGKLGALLLLNKDLAEIFGNREGVINGIIDYLQVLIALGGGTPESTFCSQFVYKCYEGAGITLEIDNPVIPRSASPKATILDLCLDNVSKKKSTLEGATMAASYDEGLALEESAGSLLSALEEAKASTTLEMSAIPDQLNDELTRAVVQFAIAFEGSNLPEELEYEEIAVQALKLLRKENMVTPGELTRIGNKNAELVGSFTI